MGNVCSGSVLCLSSFRAIVHKSDRILCSRTNSTKACLKSIGLCFSKLPELAFCSYDDQSPPFHLVFFKTQKPEGSLQTLAAGFRAFEMLGGSRALILLHDHFRRVWDIRRQNGRAGTSDGSVALGSPSLFVNGHFVICAMAIKILPLYQSCGEDQVEDAWKPLRTVPDT